MSEMEDILNFVALSGSWGRVGEILIVKQEDWSCIQVLTTEDNITKN